MPRQMQLMIPRETARIWTTRHERGQPLVVRLAEVFEFEPGRFNAP